MAKQPSHLPPPLALCQPEVGVHEVERTFRRVDQEQLRATGLPRPLSQRDPVTAQDGPAGQHKIAVGAAADMDIGLKHGVAAEVATQQPRLIVVVAAVHEPIHLLQADQIGILRLDAVDDPTQCVAAIPAADALVNIPAQQPHAACSSHAALSQPVWIVVRHRLRRGSASLATPGGAARGPGYNSPHERPR